MTRVLGGTMILPPVHSPQACGYRMGPCEVPHISAQSAGPSLGSISASGLRNIFRLEIAGAIVVLIQYKATRTLCMFTRITTNGCGLS